MRQIASDSIHQATIGFQTARRNDDIIEAAEYALELLRGHATRTFSPDAVVIVERAHGIGPVELTATDIHGRYGMGNHRVQTLVRDLGEDVLELLPAGHFALR